MTLEEQVSKGIVEVMVGLTFDVLLFCVTVSTFVLLVRGSL